jgi:peptidoglycan/xylan/chitin deacetylase (PgdA/CDA1 family)
LARLVGFDINFDSLGWALALSRPDFRDPTYFEIADRFFALSERFDFRYTIFIIGKDLENPEVAARVRDWHQQGHEIGNHSYHHYANLGALTPSDIEYEVMKSHELIAGVCGAEPRGFIAPAWATSTQLLRVLSRNRYLYDTSQFSSYLMWPIAWKLWWNFRGDPRQRSMIQRKDWFQNLVGETRPFIVEPHPEDPAGAGTVVVLPLPVTPLLRLPCWHTLSFFLPPSVFRMILRRALRAEHFYYLVHPADAMDEQDLRDFSASGDGCLERMDSPRDRKLARLETWFREVRDHSRQVVPLREIAADVLRQKHPGG